MKSSIFRKCRTWISLLAIVTLLAGIASYVPAVADGLTPAGDPSMDLTQLVMNKTATQGEDGKFTLNVETYVTGEVAYTPVEMELPSDIVLVLDRSSSMTSNDLGRVSRYNALKTSVNSFIRQIGTRYTSETDHRISIVAFGDSASLVADWTVADTAGVAALQKTVTNYSNTQSNTEPATGLKMAKTQLQKEYTGTSSSNRRKIVILFTDGFPAPSGSTFSLDALNEALAAADDIKKLDNGTLIFTVGIFENADATCTYGDKAIFQKLGLNTTNTCVSSGNNKCDIYDYSKTGAVGTQWLCRNATGDDTYIPAANRFLNFASSNYGVIGSDGVGLKMVYKSKSVYSYTGFEITKNYDCISDKYYLTANDADGLTAAFTTISDWIKTGGTTIRLDKRAVVKDIVSDYFKLASLNVADIHTSVAACNGKDANGFTFATPVPTADAGEEFASVQVTISDFVDKNDHRDVSVTGFDFTKHYVGYDESARTACGYKLIITFDILPVDGFAGGNDVPTNDPASGIYPTADSEPLARYPEPEVNIPLNEPEFNVDCADMLIYPGNTVSADVMFKLDELDAIKDHFIERLVKYNNVEVPDGLFSPHVTTVYPKGTISVTLLPTKENPSGNVGETAEPVTVTNPVDITIYVLEPQVSVSVKDISRYYGSSYALNPAAEDVGESVTLNWNKPTACPLSSVNDGCIAPYDESEIVVSYMSSGYNGTVGKKDIPVTVGASLYGTDPIEGTVTVNTTCALGCNPASRTDGTYIIHTKTCDLTVVSNGGDASETFVYTIMKDGAVYTKVSMKGGQSVKLSELPIGEYTVVPDEAWAWRYSTAFKNGISKVTLNATDPSGTVTCTNTKTQTMWNSVMSKVKVNAFSKLIGG